MYFVVHPKQRGKTNAKQIEKIEDFLIEAGAAKNPEIQNVRGAKRPTWNIKGVIRGDKGRPSKSAIEFRKLFDL